MGGQAVKIALKAVALPFVSAYGLVTNSKVPECMTWRGIAKDSLILLNFADKTGHSALSVLCAPPEEYRSLGEAFINTVELVILGEYHNSGKGQNDPASKVEDVFKYVIHDRIEYSRSLFGEKKHDSNLKAC